MLAAKFMETDHFSRLNSRQLTFLMALEHLEQFEDGKIIETGSLRPEHCIETDGGSSLIWDWVIEQIPGIQATSIDIRKEPGQYVARACKHVKPITSDSLTYLSTLNAEDLKDVRLLYLDSFDWHPDIHMQSAFHHLAELMCVWRLLPAGCLIMLDDRHTDDQGKHFLVDQFMQRLGIIPHFKSYQIGWIKP